MPPAAQAVDDGRNRRIAVVFVVVVLAGLLAAAAGSVLVWRTGVVQALLQGGGRDEAVDATEIAAVGELPSSEDDPAADSDTPAADDQDPDADRGTAAPAGTVAQPITDRAAEDLTPDPASTTSSQGRVADPASRTTTEGASVRPAISASESTTPAPKESTASAVPQGHGTVVIAYGERLLAGEVEAFLERALARAGFDLVDEKGLADMITLVGEGASPRPEDIRTALRPHAHQLVVVRAEFLGERPLRYMGRRDRAFQARLMITPFDLEAGEALAESFNEKVEYTHLSAERVVARTLRPKVPQLVDRLRH